MSRLFRRSEYSLSHLRRPNPEPRVTGISRSLPDLEKVNNVALAASCASDAPKVFCTECNYFNCETCSVSHNKSTHSNKHTVKDIFRVPSDDILNSNAPRKIDFCVKHLQPVKYLCNKCKEEICTICRVFEHMDHGITYLRSKKSKKQKHTEQETTEHMRNPYILCTKTYHGCAAVFCAECVAFYCETCFALHQNFEYISAHTITQLDQMSQHDIGQAHASIAKNLCAEHRQPLRHRCNTCSKYICAICYSGQHLKHEVQNISGQMQLTTETADCSSNPESTFCCKRDHGIATVFCQDCKELYCLNCKANHQLYDSMIGHKLRPIETLSTYEIKEATMRDKHTRCREHDMLLNIICKMCDTLVCEMCDVKHIDHHQSLTYTSRGIEEQRHTIADYLKKQFDLLQQMGNTKQTIVSEVKSAKQRIQVAARKFRDIINNHEKELLRNLDQCKMHILEKVDCVIHDYELRHSEAAKLKGNIDMLYDFGNDADLVKQMPALQGDLCAMTNTEQQVVTWKHVYRNMEQTEQAIKVMLGHIQLKEPIKLDQYVKYKALKYPGRNVVSGMVVVGNLLCVTHTDNSDMWLYDLVSDHHKKCPVPGLKDPRGMALLQPGDSTVVITDQHKSRGRLHYVKISQNLTVTHIKEKNISIRNPRKVFSHSRELLIGQMGGSQFSICNADGVEQKRFTLTNDNFPRCVARTPVGYVALTWDKEKKCTIEWMDQNGKRTHTYGCNDGEHFQRAHHMVVDKEGMVIMADYHNDKIHLIDSNGRLLQFLLKKDDGILGPMCVYIDEESGLLYVAHGQIGSMEVRAYKWPQGNPSITNFELELSLSGTFV